MNIGAFLAILFGLQVICFFVGRQSSKKSKGEEDYFLAGRGVRFFPLMMTFVATQIGGGLMLGAADEAYQFGWKVFFYPLGATLGLIALGLGLGKRMAQFQVSTIAQIFELVYRSKALKQVASILSMVSLFIILIAQMTASHKFMLSLGMTSPWLFIAFWSIVIIYTALGGLQAVIATDLIQAAFFIVVLIVAGSYIAVYNPLPLNTLVENTSAVGSCKMFGWLVMPLLFMMIEQDMGQRCFAADNPRTISKAILMASVIIVILCTIPLFFGILAKAMGLLIPEGASVFMTLVTATTSPLMTAFVACALLVAIISTADSLINAIGSNLSQDFSFKTKNMRSMQLFSLLIASSALILSFAFTNVVDLLILSYELSVSCLSVPVIIALIKRKGEFLSALLAVSLGALGLLIGRLITSDLPRELWGPLFSLGGYFIGEFIVSRKELDVKVE